MSMAQSFESHGIRFFLQFDHFMPGVMLRDLDKVNHPKFQEAFQEAVKTYRAVDKVCGIVQVYDFYHELSSFEEHGTTAYEAYNKAKEALANPEYLDSDTIATLKKLIRHVEYPTFTRRYNGKVQPVEGFVYLAQEKNGYYKIGKSKNPQKRVTTIGYQRNSTIDLIHAIQTDDYTRLERDLHTTWLGFNVNGEWFDLSDNAVDWICSERELNYWEHQNHG